MRQLLIGVLIFFPALAWAAPDESPAKPLPGNKPCPYPAAAQQRRVAGPVSFLAQVRPDGTTASVEVRKAPLPDLGFEEAVQGCVREWRFEPAAEAEEGLRTYEGEIRYRLAPAEESAIRVLVEALATAWNAGDARALEELALRSDDVQPIPAERDGRALHDQLVAGGATGDWQMALEPEASFFRYLRSDAVVVSQKLRPVGEPGSSQIAVLDAVAVKSSRGWRIARVSAVEAAWLEAVRVGPAGPGRLAIPGPRRIKSVGPRYPAAVQFGGVHGTVVLDCLISSEGKVTHVRVLKGTHELLDGAAVEAVRQWEYEPKLLDGKAVPVAMTVVLAFGAHEVPAVIPNAEWSR